MLFAYHKNGVSNEVAKLQMSLSRLAVVNPFSRQFKSVLKINLTIAKTAIHLAITIRFTSMHSKINDLASVKRDDVDQAVSSRSSIRVFTARSMCF